MKKEPCINFALDINRYDLPWDEFNLRQNQFDQNSELHGIMHTYRVMIHVLNLGMLTGFEHEAKMAFFAAYIHDMARKHDGYCTRHGEDAVKNHFHKYKHQFERYGASKSDLDRIAYAVKLHPLPDVTAPDPETQRVINQLKDADALDRIRLGEKSLDTSFLRLKISHECIAFAGRLFLNSYKLSSATFQQIIDIASQHYE
ncbi:MAG: hypothetical protein PHX54_07265 [Lentimicrobiaceae bacterium]|nr:hypothetical protein [Lentimicrobiaceae bacterium]